MEKIIYSTTKEQVQMHAKYVCEYAETLNRVWNAATELLLSKWNGKALNRRFCTQLNEMFANETITGYEGRQFPLINVSIDDSWGNKDIRIYVAKRSYDYHNQCCYFDKEVYGNTVSLHDKCYDKEGHLIAEVVVKRIEMCIDSNRKLIYKLQDAAKNFDRYKKAYDKAKRAFLDACSKINHMFVETDLRTYQYNAQWDVEMEQTLGIYQKHYNI